MGRAVLAKLTLKVSHVSLGVGNLTHVVHGASEGGCTLVARESLAQPTLHRIPPSLIKAVSCPAHDTARLTEAFSRAVLRLFVRLELLDEDQAAGMLT